ncbi:MAG: hypothetical protein Q8P12_05850 [bacterium]|nr:hypothetical protein [bacterium]
MPVIKVWCLPQQSEEDLNKLHQSIVAGVTSVKELGLKDEKDMTVLFPPDMMMYGLGDEVIVEISGLFVKPERTQEVRQRLAKSVGENVSVLCPNAKVECFVQPFDPAQGFWSSTPG